MMRLQALFLLFLSAPLVFLTPGVGAVTTTPAPLPGATTAPSPTAVDAAGGTPIGGATPMMMPVFTTTPAPAAAFCLSCGFSFGHIMDGIDDKTAGMLLVAAVTVVLCLLCFCIGCCCCARSSSSSGYSAAESSEDTEAAEA